MAATSPQPMDQISVPSEVGKTMAAGRTDLQSQGFVVSTQGSGNVTSQSPTAGTKVNYGSTVTLYSRSP